MKIKPILSALRRGVLPLLPLVILFAMADLYHNAARSKFLFYMIPVLITAVINFSILYWLARRKQEKAEIKVLREAEKLKSKAKDPK